MQESNRARFVEIISGLASAFGREPDAAMFAGYWMGLDDLPIDAIEAAARRAMRECEFFPKPIELRRLTGDLSGETRAIMAWDAVAKALRRDGTYRSVSFDDPVVNATLRNMGGWERLGMMPEEEFAVWGRKEFERIYAALCSTGVTAEASKHLPGITERQNSSLPNAPAPDVVHVITGLPQHRESPYLEHRGTLRLLSSDGSAA